MKSIKKKIISFILITILSFSAFVPGVFMHPAEAVSVSNAESLIKEILECEMTAAGAGDLQKLIDGKYSKNAGKGSDWFVYSLIQYKGKGAYSYNSYIKALTSYAETSSTGETATGRERIALLFASLGQNPDYIKTVVNNDIGGLGIMSYVFGLHLLNNGYTSSKNSSAEVIKTLLSYQLDNGGWDISNKNADVDVTAMVIQSLAPYYATDSVVKKAVDKALAWLSSVQLDNGGFRSYGNENPESAAQVIVALTSLNRNPFTDSAFTKNGKNAYDSIAQFKLSSGGYSHTKGGAYNLTATSQVLYALVSVYRYSNGKGPLYIFNSAQQSQTTTAKSTTKQATTTTSQSKPTTTESLKTTRAGNNTTQTTTTKKSDVSVTTVASSTESVTEKTRKSGSGLTTTTRPYKDRNTTKADVTTTEKTTVKDKTTKASTTVKETVKTTVKPSVTVIDSTSFYESTSAEYTEPYEETYTEETYTDYETEYITEYMPEEADDESTHISPKAIIVAVIWALAVAASAFMLFAKGNKKPVNYIIIAVLAGILTGAVFMADISTPEDYYSVTDINKADAVTVSISIRCDTVAGKGSEEITPADGVILPSETITLTKGATVYDALIYVAKQNQIQIENKTQGADAKDNAYISGINYLYEFDYGNLSGWMYSVNGDFANVGCGQYTLSDSDSIVWSYTCDLGEDIR